MCRLKNSILHQVKSRHMSWLIRRTWYHPTLLKPNTCEVRISRLRVDQHICPDRCSWDMLCQGNPACKPSAIRGIKQELWVRKHELPSCFFDGGRYISRVTGNYLEIYMKDFLAVDSYRNYDIKITLDIKFQQLCIIKHLSKFTHTMLVVLAIPIIIGNCALSWIITALLKIIESLIFLYNV